MTNMYVPLFFKSFYNLGLDKQWVLFYLLNYQHYCLTELKF
jgi:hypothetical protein